MPRKFFLKSHVVVLSIACMVVGLLADPSVGAFDWRGVLVAAGVSEAAASRIVTLLGAAFFFARLYKTNNLHFGGGPDHAGDGG